MSNFLNGGPGLPTLVASDADAAGMHGPRRILGPDGQPLPPREKLAEEVAMPQLIGARAFWDQTVATGLTPDKLAALLRATVRGDVRAYLTLAEEMEERDLHYQGVLAVRKRAIAGIKASVEPRSEKRADKKVADFVRELIEEPQFTDLVEELMDGIGKGYSVCEIMWGERDGKWVPLSYIHRDPRYFTFDYVSRTDLRLQEFGTIDGVEIPPGKFIRHMPKLKTGIPIRAGLARSVAWGFMFKAFSIKNWAAFLDVYGMPLRVGKYHPAASEAERRSLLRAVAGIATDAAAIIPESMVIDFIEAKNAGQPSYENKARYIDEQVSKIVVGQTMSTDNGSSKAQAQVHNEVRMDIVEWDGRQLARTINRDLIAWAVALNFGQNAKAPWVEFPMPKREDIAVKSTAIAKLVPLGLKVAQTDVREMIGMPEPKDETDLLAPPVQVDLTGDVADEAEAEGDKPPAPQRQAAKKVAMNAFAPHVRGCRCGACSGLALNREQAPAAIDEVDQIGLDEAQDWERQVGPIADAILAAADQSASFEDFRAKLRELAGELDTSALEKRLAVAGMKAKGLGEHTDDV